MTPKATTAKALAKLLLCHDVQTDLAGQTVASVLQAAARGAVLQEHEVEGRVAVAMGKAAHLVTTDLGPQVIESGWAGTGSFKNLLLSVEGRGFEILLAPNTPGYLYDPERHERPSVDWAGDELRELHPELVTFIGRVSQVTGTQDKFRGLPLGARAVQIADGRTSNYFLTTF